MNRMSPFADMGGLDRELLGIVDRIYAAALDPTQWADVMDAIVRLLDGMCGNCAVLRPRNQEEAGFWTASRNTPAAVIESYVAYYHQKDVLLDAIERRPELVGVPITGGNMISWSEFSKTEIYNDFLKPGGAADVSALVIRGRTPLTPATVVNVIRPRWNDGEDERARYILGTLRPHLERALGLHWQLAEERLRSFLALDALHGLSIGVAMLDGSGHVLQINRSAEAVLAAKDGLLLSNRRIVAQNRADATALQALLGGTATGQRRLDQGGTMSVRRPSGARPYVVTVMRAEEGSPAHRFGSTLLFIKDPNDTPLPDVAQLKRLFGLSPAEARLCVALASGQTMQEFADAMKVSANTAKTHLRNVFSKTETARQTDLVRLLLASLPPSRPINGG
jgi:DNA-binding CsgD family transcriptional regulator/PAS domain-containing protein